MEFNLRYYQRDAIQTALNVLQQRADVNPCIEIPTGGGKTPIIATLCKVFADAGARTLVVAHRKELLEQTVDKLRQWASNVEVGLVSAGLNQQNYEGQVVVAGVQSIYRNADKLLQYGKIDFVLVDEAHLIPSTDENADGMYQTLLKSLRSFNSNLRVIGLTATPYRLSTGSVCGEDKILTEICYKVGVAELIGNGYLSQLISKAPPSSVAEMEFKIERGEYKTNEVNEAYNVESVVYEACQEIARLTANRKSVLIFCCSVDHCHAVAETLSRLTKEEVGVVIGDTKKDVRADLLRRFKGELKSDLLGNSEKPLKYLTNVEVLTTGFDATNIDCVVLLRPTASPGLFYQMCGRGFRLHEGKKDCLILDFAGNLGRFGAIDKLEAPADRKKHKREATTKTCPICFEVIDINARVCPRCNNRLNCVDFNCPSCGAGNDISANYCVSCGFKFREEAHHDIVADSTHEILSSGNELPTIDEDVLSVQYFEHTGKKSGKKTLRVEYTTPTTTLCEYVCFEHEGFAREKAERWWRSRTTVEPVPVSVKQAFEICDGVGVAKPKVISYRPKKPNEYSPTILRSKPDEAKLQKGLFPRTDNPFRFECPECKCHSFLYENPKPNTYFVLCAKCETVIGEVSRNTFDTNQEMLDELEVFKSRGIGWYSPNSGFEDFYQINEVQDDYNELDNDIPF